MTTPSIYSSSPCSRWSWRTTGTIEVRIEDTNEMSRRVMDALYLALSDRALGVDVRLPDGASFDVDAVATTARCVPRLGRAPLTLLLPDGCELTLAMLVSERGEIPSARTLVLRARYLPPWLSFLAWLFPRGFQQQKRAARNQLQSFVDFVFEQATVFSPPRLHTVGSNFHGGLDVRPLWNRQQTGPVRLRDFLFFPQKTKLLRDDNDDLCLSLCRRILPTSRRALLLHGESGCGKTSAVYMIAQELNAEVIHIPSRAMRTRDGLRTVIRTSSSSSSSMLPRLYVFENVDADVDMRRVMYAASPLSLCHSSYEPMLAPTTPTPPSPPKLIRNNWVTEVAEEGGVVAGDDDNEDRVDLPFLLSVIDGSDGGSSCAASFVFTARSIEGISSVFQQKLESFALERIGIDDVVRTVVARAFPRGTAALGPNEHAAEVFCASRGEEVSALYRQHQARETRFLPAEINAVLEDAVLGFRFRNNNNNAGDEEYRDGRPYQLFDACMLKLKDLNG